MKKNKKPVDATVGMVVMGILGARLDHSRRKSNWIEQSVNLVAQICIVLAVVALCA